MSEFRSVRDRDRRFIDDRSNPRREGLLVGRWVRSDWPSASSASAPCSPWRHFVCRHWFREREGAISTGQRVPRLRIRLLNLCLSPVVKYHGLGRATGFGDLPPCHTLGSLLDVASTDASAVDWLNYPERAGLRSRPFKLTAPRPASFPATFPTASVPTAPAKTESTTRRERDAQLALSLNGCPTSACSRQAPSPRLRRSSGPCC